MRTSTVEQARLAQPAWQLQPTAEWEVLNCTKLATLKALRRVSDVLNDSPSPH